MSLGKRSININLGGASGSSSALNARANPLGRPAKSALGFDNDDDDDDSEKMSGPPKRKLIKLDHDQDNNVADSSKLKDSDDDAFARLSASTPSGALRPPQLKKLAAGDDDDDDDDAFSRLQPKKGTSHGRIQGTRDVRSTAWTYINWSSFAPSLRAQQELLIRPSGSRRCR